MKTEGTRYCMHLDEYTWSEYDARGIYLALVCDKCVDVKLKEYRQDVLTNPDYWTDEEVG